MRKFTLLGLFCGCSLFLGTAPTWAAEKPSLELTDEGLPLQEIRPLDRHVYILTLEGKWNRPPKEGTKHYINVLFPNGQSSSHQVLNEALFRQGEVRCLLPEYALIRNGVAKGGVLVLVVSENRGVASEKAKEVISDALTVAWPMERAIVSRPPNSRHTQPAPIDAMPLSDDPQLKYAPAPPKIMPRAVP